MIELMAACGAWVVVNILQLHRMLSWLNRKPFACDICLSGWFTLVLSIGAVYWLYVPFKMAMAMMLTIVIGKIMNKL